MTALNSISAAAADDFGRRRRSVVGYITLTDRDKKLSCRRGTARRAM